MALVSYDPWTQLQQIREEMNRMLRSPLLAGEDASSVVTGQWVPAVDIREDDDRYVLKADLPGVDPKDVEITLENGVLTIRGERKFESEQDREGYKRVERVYGTFYRRFALPDTVDADNVQANYKNGVLELVIPKLQQAQARRIEVKAEA